MVVNMRFCGAIPPGSHSIQDKTGIESEKSPQAEGVSRPKPFTGDAHSTQRFDHRLQSAADDVLAELPPHIRDILLSSGAFGVCSNDDPQENVARLKQMIQAGTVPRPIVAVTEEKILDTLKDKTHDEVIEHLKTLYQSHGLAVPDAVTEAGRQGDPRQKLVERMQQEGRSFKEVCQVLARFQPYDYRQLITKDLCIREMASSLDKLIDNIFDYNGQFPYYNPLLGRVVIMERYPDQRLNRITASDASLKRLMRHEVHHAVDVVGGTARTGKCFSEDPQFRRLLMEELRESIQQRKFLSESELDIGIDYLFPIFDQSGARFMESWAELASSLAGQGCCNRDELMQLFPKTLAVIREQLQYDKAVSANRLNLTA